MPLADSDWHHDVCLNNEIDQSGKSTSKNVSQMHFNKINIPFRTVNKRLETSTTLIDCSLTLKQQQVGFLNRKTWIKIHDRNNPITAAVMAMIMSLYRFLIITLFINIYKWCIILWISYILYCIDGIVRIMHVFISKPHWKYFK